MHEVSRTSWTYLQRDPNYDYGGKFFLRERTEAFLNVFGVFLQKYAAKSILAVSVVTLVLLLVLL